MTVAQAFAEAHRYFVQWAPAVLSCDGDVGCERVQLGRLSISRLRNEYEYWLGEVARLEADSMVGALAQGLSHDSSHGG